MPIYEYLCNRCKKEFSLLFLKPTEVENAKCRHCNSRDIKKLLSAFAVHQTEESRLANIDTSKPKTESYYKDSRNIGLLAKKRMKDMGVDLGPKMDEIVERGRSGKILEDYNK